MQMEVDPSRQEAAQMSSLHDKAEMIARWIRSICFRILNSVPIHNDAKYVYVHDLDGKYKLMFVATFNYLPEHVKELLMSVDPR